MASPLQISACLRQGGAWRLLTLMCVGWLCLVGLGCDRSQTPASANEPKALDLQRPEVADKPGSSRSDANRPLPKNQPVSKHSADAVEETRWMRPAPPSIEVSATEPDADKLVSAKPRYERIVPRVTLRSWQRFENLVYEANNLVMRGPRNQTTGLYERSGAQIASTWRRYARGVAGLFVLRDSLFSQQDHPVANDPYAPLLPPNWVTAVAHAAATFKTFDVPELPEVDDHEAWRGFETQRQLFGDLPSSESLFEAAVATKPGSANARSTLHILYLDARAMVAAMEGGPEAVAKVGAERIAASDRAYFGAETRRARIIPIFVENPNPHEMGEGKGIDLPDREVSPEVLSTVFRAIYARRLDDGDLAIERYDVSKPVERRRAVSVLEALIPESTTDDETTRVWLWITGKLDPDKKLQGDDARPYIATLREEIDAGDIDTSRLELFSKPSIALPAEGFEASLERELAQFEALDMAMSLELPTTHVQLRKVICCTR